MEAANDGHINTVFPMGRMGRNGLRQTMKELIILQESPVKLKRKEGKNWEQLEKGMMTKKKRLKEGIHMLQDNSRHK